VHAWRARLHAPKVHVDGLLSNDELARAQRFVRTADRERWMASRAILRVLLGRYLNMDPRSLTFRTSTDGKPALANAATPRFNLSHSEDLALYAFSGGVELGVDVERSGRLTNPLGVARRIFGEEAERSLRSLDSDSREREFLRAWVRHEAAGKCRGTGIGPTAAFDEPSLSIVDLDVGPDAAGALAVGGFAREVRVFDWSSAGANPYSPRRSAPSGAVQPDAYKQEVAGSSPAPPTETKSLQGRAASP